MKSLKLSLDEGEILLGRLLKDGVDIAHDCGGVLACSSCHLVMREGLEQLDAASEEEIDMLDRAGAEEPGARLACQVPKVRPSSSLSRFRALKRQHVP